MSTARNPHGLTLMDLFRRLFEAYGPQHWWPGDTPFEIAVGAILTQSASWKNVEKAIANLKSAGLFTAHAIASAPLDTLARLVRPSGYYNVKARKLQAFARHLVERHAGSIERMLSGNADRVREELLSIYGIGEETADDILLYAGGKPVFVVDAYTRRILDRLRFRVEGRSYGAYQALFHRHLPRDAGLFNEYHALFVRHGKERCRKRPACEGCPLTDVCPVGRGEVPTQPEASA